jgi:hypothetical protein
LEKIEDIIGMPECRCASIGKMFAGFFLISLFVINTAPDQSARLSRENLPVRVSDRTWKVFEEIQKVQNLTLEFDFSRKNGTISDNVRAQYLLQPSRLKIGIVLYDKDVTEEVLAHEALHVLYICQGYPFFYRNVFRITKTIENIENSIQHMHIYKVLEEMGFNPRPEARKNWIEGLAVFQGSLQKIPQRADEYELRALGAEFTFSGLVNGIDLQEIRENIPPRIKGGLTSGVEIYNELKKYNLSEKEDNFKARIFVASTLGLTAKDTVIGELDFRNRIRSYFDPNDGSLLLYLK